MDDKELLEKICLHCEHYHQDMCYRAIAGCEEWHKLEKDLKILEIFKKELVIEIEYNYLTEKYDVFIYGERGFGEKTKIVIDKDKGDLLKEWLANGK